MDVEVVQNSINIDEDSVDVTLKQKSVLDIDLNLPVI